MFEEGQLYSPVTQSEDGAVTVHLSSDHPGFADDDYRRRRNQIAELRASPRVGLLEIARRLGVARGTVQARLSKLEQRGIVTGYGPEVEPAAMGYPIQAFVLMELAQGRLSDAVRILEGVPEVIEADAISGPYDRITPRCASLSSRA